jgi:nicotinamide phosphoribosyltransferase
MNNIYTTDSYKTSHYLQYPEGTEKVYSYIESRGGDFNEVVFFGLQKFLKELDRSIYNYKPVVNRAKMFFNKHGVPFNEKGWRYLNDNYDEGYPIKIRAVPEGTIVPVNMPLVTIENTDPNCYWLTSYVETALLRAVWYPCTVATISRECKKIIKAYLDKTSDDTVGQLPFKLHDFGARGVSSSESAAIGGAAHLVNFKGSDTIEGILCAKEFYYCDMAGFSIPAAEHSTITAWGKENEEAAYANMLGKFPNGPVAVVSDSYDIYNAVDNIWGKKLKDRVLNRDGVVIIRPDSGYPPEVILKILDSLGKSFGYAKNKKGYKVLNPKVRVIQGDGNNLEMIRLILQKMMAKTWSADNIAFGMGGGLLQDCNRDTLKFAMKTSYVEVNGEGRDVFKDPITDVGKKSKKGKLGLYGNEYGEISMDPTKGESILETVYENGRLLKEYTLDEVRENAKL